MGYLFMLPFRNQNRNLIKSWDLFLFFWLEPKEPKVQGSRKMTKIYFITLQRRSYLSAMNKSGQLYLFNFRLSCQHLRCLTLHSINFLTSFFWCRPDVTAFVFTCFLNVLRVKSNDEAVIKNPANHLII